MRIAVDVMDLRKGYPSETPPVRTGREPGMATTRSCMIGFARTDEITGDSPAIAST